MNQEREHQISNHSVRPRFRHHLDYSREEFIKQIRSALNQEEATCKGWINLGGYGKITLPIDQQHYWSPQLTLTFEENDQGIILKGLYGPRETVWTMFIFFYFIIGVSAMIILVFGLSKLFLNRILMSI